MDDTGPGTGPQSGGLDRATALQLAETALRGYVNYSDVLELAGRHDEAVEAAETGIAVAARVALTRTFGAYLTGNLVESLFRLGRWADAERLATEALAAAPEGIFAATLLQVRAEIAISAGRAADARTFAEQVRRIVADMSDDQFLQPLAYVEAELARASGDLADARASVAAAS